MNRKNITIGVGTLVLVVMLIMSTNVNASSGTSGNKRHTFNKSAIKTAIESNDYDAFKAAISSTPKPADTPEITEAAFAKMVEADKLRKSGDHQGARQIMMDLGFDKQPSHHKGKGVMYANLTEEQKIVFEEAKELRKEGKRDEAKKILLNAGIIKPVRVNK